MSGSNTAKGPHLRVVETGPLKGFQAAGDLKKSTERQYSSDSAPSQVVPKESSLVWSSDQSAALIKITKWRRGGGPEPFKLWGHAGTGKSTILAHIARETPGAVVLTPTNKAASILKAQGIRARTIHSFAYAFEGCEADRLRERIEMLAKSPVENRVHLARLNERLEALLDDAQHRGLRPTGELYFDERVDEDAARPALLIVDEASMVTDEQAKRLLSFNVPILAVGDVFQLPPPKQGVTAPFVLGAPDAMLREIHRQAEGSPIIRLSQAIREGRRDGFQTEANEAGSVRILRGYIPDEALSAEAVDQIVVGRHVLRRSLNARVRKLRGFTTDTPMRGERLLSKTNSQSDRRELCNGDILIVEDPGVVTRDDDGNMRWDGDVSHEGLDDFFEVAADVKMLCASADDTPGAGEAVATHPPPGFDDLHFGYAITCHSAQGSQWRKVLVKDGIGLLG